MSSVADHMGTVYESRRLRGREAREAEVRKYRASLQERLGLSGRRDKGTTAGEPLAGDEWAGNPGDGGRR